MSDQLHSAVTTTAGMTTPAATAAGVAAAAVGIPAKWGVLVGLVDEDYKLLVQPTLFEIPPDIPLWYRVDDFFWNGTDKRDGCMYHVMASEEKRWDPDGRNYEYRPAYRIYFYPGVRTRLPSAVDPELLIPLGTTWSATPPDGQKGIFVMRYVSPRPERMGGIRYRNLSEIKSCERYLKYKEYRLKKLRAQEEAGELSEESDGEISDGEREACK